MSGGHIPIGPQGVPAAALLQLSAATLDDLETIRKATANRIRAMGDDHGLAGTPEYERAEAILGALDAAEALAVKELQRTMKKHPLGPWVEGTAGIGLKQGGRLIAAIGDPGWNTLEDRPRRGPAELWAYCGYVPGQRRKRGERANWNADAKMRAFLCAESCMKNRQSAYRDVYDRARAKHEDAVHPDPCVRCGPSGHPAPAGSELSDGHKHARALREVAKAILKDLWLEARAVSRQNNYGLQEGVAADRELEVVA